MTVSKTRMMVASRRRVPTASSRCSCRGSEYSKTRYSISKTRMILMAASDGVCHLASANPKTASQSRYIVAGSRFVVLWLVLILIMCKVHLRFGQYTTRPESPLLSILGAGGARG